MDNSAYPEITLQKAIYYRNWFK